MIVTTSPQIIFCDGVFNGKSGFHGVFSRYFIQFMCLTRSEGISFLKVKYHTVKLEVYIEGYTVERPYKGSPYKGNFCDFGKSFGCPYKGNPCLKFSKIFNPRNLPYGKIQNFAYAVKIDYFASQCKFLLN